MTNLVLLSEEREKQAIEDQQSLIAGLKKLLEAAENGELKGVCYATVNRGDMLSFGTCTLPNVAWPNSSACRRCSTSGSSKLRECRKWAWGFGYLVQA